MTATFPPIGTETDPVAQPALTAHIAAQPAHGGDLAGTARPPTAHGHPQSDVTGLAAALAAKQDAAATMVSVKNYGAIGDGVTDDLAAINAALAALGTLGGALYFPAGTYAVSAMVTVPGGVTLVGTAMDYGATDSAPARGSIIQARAGFAPSSNAVIRLSDDAVSFASGKTGASLDGMIVDAAFRANTAIRTAGRRNYIRWCQAWRGTSIAVDMQGQNGYLLDSVLGLKSGATAGGSTLRVTNQDNKIYRNQIREGGGEQVLLDNAGEVELSHNHIFGGYTGTAGRADIRIVNGNSGWRITDNTIEATIGHQIVLTVPASTTQSRLIVAGNNFYQIAGFPAATYDVVVLDLSAAASILRQVVIAENTVMSSGGTYRSLVNKTGAGTLEQVSMSGNQCSGLDNAGIMRGFRADHSQGNSSRYYNGTVTAIYRTDNGGRALFNGTGAQTAFVIPHGLAAAPDHVTVTPGGTDGKGDFFVTADATNITVTYGTAPVAGTNNVVLNWRAQQ